MPLNDFIQVTESATVGGAPIDAFQADAFRRNDDLFEQILQGLLASPLVPNGADGAVSNPAPQRLVQGTTVTLSSGTTCELLPQIPLIWLARERIIIDGMIDAKGKGGPRGQDGDFGGSGGGGNAAAGNPCRLPVSGHQIIAGGAAGAAGTEFPVEWAARILACLGICRGGAGGGGANGGAGGGIVVLCAPEIHIGSQGRIEAHGTNGGANSGGGGGGFIVLIARRMSTVRDTGGSPNVFVPGGTAPAGSGAGGRGRVLRMAFN